MLSRRNNFDIEEIWFFLDFHCIVLLHSYTYFKPTQSTQVHSVQHPAVVQQCFSFRKKEREREYRTNAMVVPRESRLTFRPRSPSHHEMFCTHHETIQREKERRRLKDCMTLMISLMENHMIIYHILFLKHLANS